MDPSISSLYVIPEGDGKIDDHPAQRDHQGPADGPVSGTTGGDRTRDAPRLRIDGPEPHRARAAVRT